MSLSNLIFASLFLYSISNAQTRGVPYLENFDASIATPLPAGWSTTTNRSTSGDFSITKSTPRSDSNAVVSTNATIPQALLSPALDFTGTVAESLIFYERRTATHNSDLIVEASTDGGSTFPFQLSDFLQNAGSTAYVQRAYKLPSSFDGQPGIIIRWRIVGNGSGSSGTIRFDDIAVTARERFDAAISRITIMPLYPSSGDTLTISATVSNAGTESLEQIPVDFYDDANSDSLPQSTELIERTIVDTRIDPGDSAAAQVILPAGQYGFHSIIVVAAMPGDMNRSNDFKRGVIFIGLARSSIVVNEIMYAPPSGEPEWVEIYNNTAGAIDLHSWKLGNRTMTGRYTIATTPSLLLPYDYIVITKDTALFRNVHIEPGVNILQCASLPTFLFNNTGDAVVLLDLRGNMIDSTHYSPRWGGQDGSSLERFEPVLSSTDSSNWASSGDSAGSTPGRENFITPLDYNLRAIRLLNVSSIDQHLAGMILVAVRIQNIGRTPADGFVVSLFHDLNNDSVPQASELIETQTSPHIVQHGDSVQFLFQWSPPSSGRAYLIATVADSHDLRSSDNIAYGAVTTGYSARSVIINEIMYDPVNGGAEYVELLNRSLSTVDLLDWKLSDVVDTSSGADVHTITRSSMTIGAGIYITIAADSSILKTFPSLSDSASHLIIKRSGFSLNNTGDNVILYDIAGQTTDSVSYLPSWNNSLLDDSHGRSLERINPALSSNDTRNWSTSADPRGGTPGRRNSLFTISRPSTSSISCSPNPFSPDADGVEDVTIISYNIPSVTGLVRLRIFDSAGRLVRTLADHEPSVPHGEIIWNGLNDSGEKSRIGIYIILLEALDEADSTIQTIKGVVVVAAKL